MIRNYLSIALRNVRQNPLFSLINIFSLAIGLSACMVIYLFITDELSFDSFHSKRAAIYRLDETQNFSGTNVQKVALSMPGMGPHLVVDFPEIRSYTRYYNRGKQLLSLGETQFLVENVAIADSTFLEMFDFELLAGDRQTALDEPWTIILTEETALKFFKDPLSALGASMRFADKDYKITAIAANVPENSHLKFSVITSMATFMAGDKDFNNSWGSNWVNTYLTLNPNTDIKALEAKFPAFMSRHMNDPDVNKHYTLFLQQLDNIHLGSTDIEHDYNNYRKFNGSYLDIFTIVGAFILLIASVNFMNLTTARASHRWKEIGVRSSIGAKKTQLFVQFIFESVLLAVFSLFLAVILDVLAIPALNQLIGRQLSLLTLLGEPLKLIGMVVIAVILGLLAGIYPSFYMTKFQMSTILKGGGKSDRKSIFRSSLVVVQFGLALAMIVSTLIVLQQLSFMQHKDLGFNKDHMLLLDMNKEVNEKFVTLKEELRKSRFVQGVTASGQRIGNNFHQWGFKVKADTGIVDITPSNVNVDFDYIEVYGIKVKEGRGFSKDIKRDAGYSFVINESFAKELALKETVGTPAGHGWYKNDSLGTIIGVVEDFNFNSLHYKINTLSMVVHPDRGYDEMSVKIDGAHVQEAIADVKNIWEKTVSYPFSYIFLDQHFDNLYRSDQQMSSVVTIMAGLAILISCMGLFGLVTITTAKRIKEIGIRKTLGASEFQITALLSRSFLSLIVLSFVLVSPVTWWLLKSWLGEFAYRIEINPLMFVLGGVLAVMIALLTISYHTIRSARANPVDALRYE
jgi:putative ABC transport system permease protein